MTDDFGNEIQPRRRASDTDWGALCERVDEIDRALGDNIEATQRIKQDTSELVEAFRNLQGFFYVLDYVGKLAKPLAWVALVATALAVVWDRFRAFFVSKG